MMMAGYDEDHADFERRVARLVRQIGDMDLDEKLYGGALMYLCAHYELQRAGRLAPSPDLREARAALREARAEIARLAKRVKKLEAMTEPEYWRGRIRGKRPRRYGTAEERAAYHAGYNAGRTRAYYHNGKGVVPEDVAPSISADHTDGLQA